MHSIEFSKNQKGFSLLETMFAMCIFAVGSLSIILLYYSTTRDVRYSGELDNAVSIADEYLETMLAQPYLNMASFKETRDQFNVDIALDPDPPTTADLTLANPSYGVTKITVSISWKKKGSKKDLGKYTLQYLRSEIRSNGI